MTSHEVRVKVQVPMTEYFTRVDTVEKESNVILYMVTGVDTMGIDTTAKLDQRMKQRMERTRTIRFPPN